MSEHVRQTDPFRWEGVEVKPYKGEGTHFSGITRQALFQGGDGLGCELRYFEIAAGGWSSLERHRHVHAVIVVRGEGQALVGDCILALGPNDLVQVPPSTWHQFRATSGVPLGFLCLVECGRDAPERPDAGVLSVLRSDPAIAAFVRV